MRWRAWKYLSPLVLYAAAVMAFISYGGFIWAPLIYAWIIFPAAGLFIKPNSKNMSATQEELARADRTYDFILYAIVSLQYGGFFLFLQNIMDPQL
ncbi:MAG: hypothetical protein C4308_02325 [Chitinophagaceae bacterium]